MTEQTASTDETGAVGFVLAGGQSSRMGRDKALLPFAGRPLVAHALATLREAGLSGTIAGAGPAANSVLATFAPVVLDPQPGLGPLAGICAALEAAAARYVVFLPIDLPLLPASLVAYLLHHARITSRAVTVPSVNGFAQTFPVVLDRSALPALKMELDSGKRSCFTAFHVAAESFGQPIAVVAVELLVQSGQIAHPFGLAPLHWFLNVNAPGDLQRAEAIRRHAIA
jgi:molybdopterin-guanine dinucleotide biosynthesis protein A